MPLDVVLGLQWGDEGKGKLVDLMGSAYRCVARFQGGPNAGHTLYRNGIKHVLHQIPSGIFHDEVICVIGNGVIIDPITFGAETAALDALGIGWRERLWLSDKAHLILPTHRVLDQLSEDAKGAARIGSTLRGIGPAYVDKYAREGLRLSDLLAPDYRARLERGLGKHMERLPAELHPESAPLEAFFAACESLRQLDIRPVEETLLDWHEAGADILAEGAQGSRLDIDFGDYPYVTSSHTLSASACLGLGLPPQSIRRVLGVFKAYATRVGNGPFPTELQGEAADRLQRLGKEFGSTTGRARRCGWLDLPLLRQAIRLNGVTHLALTKIDIIAQLPEFQVLGVDGNWHRFEGWDPTNDREQLGESAVRFVEFLASELERPVAWVSVSPERDAVHSPTAWA